MKRCSSLAALFALVVALPAMAQIKLSNKLSYEDLVHRLTDLEYIATVPAAGEKCAQCSSYDRASKYDEKTGKYVGWDANGDGGGIIRKEAAPAGFYPEGSAEKEVSVLAEMTGPGCIWRIWSATPGKGRVVIYLDGSDKPAVDLPFTAYFDHKNAPFTRPALVHTTAGNGWNVYVPIPYQKSCKIIAEKNWGQYYHFTYTTFPAGTEVPTFKRELSEGANAALDAADKLLADPGTNPWQGKRWQSQQNATGTVEPGQTAKLLDQSGTGAVCVLEVKPELPAAPEDRAVLRELVLKMTWDDDTTPAVWCPLGDFFGTAPGLNKYLSLPLGVRDDGTMYCYWYMPYQKSARIEIANEGKAARSFRYHVSIAAPDQPADKLLRFHAKWHRDAFPPAEAERARIDWTMLKTEGAGRYVGVMLHIWSPKGGWWGEGDEKFFVDGEKFPSTIGTGSEDYFGYAWSSGRKFQHALHNQTYNDNNSKGHISVNRWHVADNVPFAKSFDGDIEKYYPNAKPTLYAATAYWYLAPGGKDPYPPVPVEERTGYYVNLPAPAAIKGAIEGEKLKVLAKTGGNTQEQDMSGYQGASWSGDAHLWWTGAKVGDKLDLALPIAKAGKYQVEVRLTKAKDYGITQIYLDGQKAGAPIDLYNPDVVGAPPVSLGEFDLTAGEHKLTFEITGANEKAQKSYMVGLDYVKLTEK